MSHKFNLKLQIMASQQGADKDIPEYFVIRDAIIANVRRKPDGMVPEDTPFNNKKMNPGAIWQKENIWLYIRDNKIIVWFDRHRDLSVSIDDPQAIDMAITTINDNLR